MLAASTQNQAFFALLFLFREVLKMPLEVNAVRGKAPRHVPVVLSVDEVRQWLDPLPAGAVELIAGLLYGAGLRLTEGCWLREKDIDFQRQQVAISLSRQSAER